MITEKALLRRVSRGRALALYRFVRRRVTAEGGLLRDEGLRGAEELDDVANLRAVGYLLLDLKDGVVEADLPVEDEAISHG